MNLTFSVSNCPFLSSDLSAFISDWLELLDNEYVELGRFCVSSVQPRDESEMVDFVKERLAS